MSDSSSLTPTEYQDQERMKKIVRVLIMAVAKVPEAAGRDAIWGGLEELQDELEKPLDPSQIIQH